VFLSIELVLLQMSFSMNDEGVNVVCAVPDSESLVAAITTAEEWLVERQKDGGYWVGMLESNSCMEAEWWSGRTNIERRIRPLEQAEQAA